MNLKIILTIPLSHISHPNSLANPKSNHSQLPCGLQYCSSFSRVSPCPPQTLLTTAAMVALSYTRLVRPHHTSAQNPPTSFRIKASPYSVIQSHWPSLMFLKPAGRTAALGPLFSLLLLPAVFFPQTSA